ncbi:MULTISPECIES: outer membrane lipoprotein-sorting protein [Aequorivita]|uniref:Outer membrane lipoprotein-sorting protein n=1 Tax=Aequorivita iocasae TaxID=2803865 RepID=A0ABX7DR55_9FLAO|nr:MULTISPECIES: outer membrane lipoprotein-sorting protein [Aequorivita]QQX76285.1 outer membrane lipoprotein-sorting protein [Aequorivita iocasae]UCA55748.1 outer membrane lipoprotein-sorting protein [Aequorivita sp. F7]
MKTIKTLVILFLFAAIIPMSAQTADEIINNYFENTGGKASWEKLQAVKMTATANTQGMEIPVEVFQTKDGNQLVKINFQGQEIVQQAFDGETMWSTNFMTMLPEKSDAEATENMKKQINDFPSPFLNYKDKGFTVELMGKETKDGTETYKIKLTQSPITVDGVEQPNVSYHYFDTETFVPIVSEHPITQGPMKGQMNVSTMSDYQEVEGLYFPFALSMAGQGIQLKEVIVNPEIDKAIFAFPVTSENSEKKE